ncbi:MAG: hypothetical protein M1837_004653 [Sclerophora amabilis]|nr:MAG: hypothetical protein M1837_004653 [Sclerophora amabilis]
MQQHEDSDSTLQDRSAGSKGEDVENENGAEGDVEKGPQPPQPTEDPNIVKFSGPEDPDNPMSWSRRYKWMITGILASMTFVCTFTSAVFSTAVNATSGEYGVSMEVTTLGTSLFVLGFAFGPIAWGPLSELYGRRVPLYVGIGGMSCFQIGVAVAQNLYTIMICRFLAGLFGCAPLAVVGGALADFWNPIDRGVTVGVYSMCTFVGPVAAPIIGGFVTESYLGWRWSQYISAILGFFFCALAVLFLPETFAPVILQRRARKIRLETRNWAMHAEVEEKEVITLKLIVEKYLTRPYRMLFSEPILLLLALYVGLAYGILYLFFTAFPISFQEQRGWSEGVGGLPFLSITIGVILGGLLNTYHTKTNYARALLAGKHTPEMRLPPMIIGGLLLPPGLFWWAWTSSPSITPWPQIIAGVPAGMGILLILVNGLNYIVDVYKINAASAIAANTVVRSIFGAVFPLFAAAMYHRLGVPWATSLLAFLTVLLLPGPILFWIYGEKIRRWSKFVPE